MICIINGIFHGIFGGLSGKIQRYHERQFAVVMVFFMGAVQSPFLIVAGVIAGYNHAKY